MTLAEPLAGGKNIQPVPADRAETLHRIARTVSSSLDIREVLERLATETLEAVPGDRCSLFLVDGDGYLVPALALGSAPDDLLWQRFRSLHRVDLRGHQLRWELFLAGQAVAIEDMHASPIVPAEIAETFGSQSAILAPLVAAGEPIGVLCVDWTSAPSEIRHEDVAFLEAVASYASLAIRNARLYESQARKATSLERLLDVAAAINSTSGLREVLDQVADAFTDLLGASHCSVNLVDGNDVDTVSVRGAPWFAGHRDVLSAVAPEEILRVVRVWEQSPDPVVYPDVRLQGAVAPELVPPEVHAAALFPLIEAGQLMGAVVLGFNRLGGPNEADLATGGALAHLASAAIARARVRRALERRLYQVEALSRLSDVVHGTIDLDTAVCALNDILGPNVHVDGVVLAAPTTRRALDAQAPTLAEAQAIRTWKARTRRNAELAPRHLDDCVLVPLVARRRLVGALRVRGEGAAAVDEELLAAVAAGCGEVVHKAVLQRDLSDSERRVAAAAERERIARDLHDSVAQVFTAMQLRLGVYLQDAPDRVWRERLEELARLASRGGSDVRDAIFEMVFHEARQGGLATSLRRLAASFESTTGLAVHLRLHPPRAAISARTEDVLFRVVHEALANVERHSRAEAVTVVLETTDDEITVSVRDDGIGLENRDPFNVEGRHFGLRGLQQLVAEAGGHLRVTNMPPRGALVEASMPLRGGACDRSRRAR